MHAQLIVNQRYADLRNSIIYKLFREAFKYESDWVMNTCTVITRIKSS